MLLLVFARLGITVTEDEVDFVGRTALVWAEHDSEGSLESASLPKPSGRKAYLIGVLLAGSKTVSFLGQEFDVCSTAVQALLQLDLVLHNEGLALGVNGLREERGDSVVGGLGFCDGQQRQVSGRKEERYLLKTRPVSPLIPGKTSGSSTAQVPTYEKISSPTGVCLVARETVQRDWGICCWNCSRNGAFKLVG